MITAAAVAMSTGLNTLERSCLIPLLKNSGETLKKKAG